MSGVIQVGMGEARVAGEGEVLAVLLGSCVALASAIVALAPTSARAQDAVAPAAVDAVAPPAVDDASMSMIAVVAELAALRADLDRLGDKLADDAVLLASHPEVQFLDAAGQRIGKIIDALRTAPPR